MSARPTLIAGRCSECIERGIKSTVLAGPSFTTLLGSYGGGFDSNGTWVDAPDLNTTTRHWRCSQGHDLTTTEKSR